MTRHVSNVVPIETTTDDLNTSERPPSLPDCLVPILDERVKWSTFGFVPSGWVPPPCLSEVQAVAVDRYAGLLKQSLEPCGAKFVRTQMGRLALNLRIEDLPDGVWKLHLEEFISDTRHLPADIVRKTCQILRRTQRFWPTISEFLEVAEPLLRERERLLVRLKVLSRVAKNPAPKGEVTFDWYLMVIADEQSETRTERAQPRRH